VVHDTSLAIRKSAGNVSEPDVMCRIGKIRVKKTRCDTVYSLASFDLFEGAPSFERGGIGNVE